MKYCDSCGRPFPTNQPTKVQNEILGYLHYHIADQGVSPTLQELADHMGGIAVSTIHEHIAAMKKKSLVDFIPHRRRSVVPLTREA